MFFEVEPTDLIQKLKPQIKSKTGIEYDVQNFIFRGGVLDPDNTFNHYNITNKSTIDMMYRFGRCELYRLVGTYNNRN